MNNNFRPISLSEGIIFEKDNTLLRKFSKNDLTDIYIKIDEDDEISSPYKKINSPTRVSSTIFYNNYYEKENLPEDKFTENKEIVKYVKPFFIDNSKSSIKYSVLIDEEVIEKIDENKSQNCSKRIKKLIANKNILVYLQKKLFMFMIHLTLISIFEIIFFFSIVSTYENKAITSVIVGFLSSVPSYCNELNYQEKLNFSNIFNSLVNTTQIDNNSDYSAVKRKSFNNELFIDAWMYFLVIIGIDIFLFIVKYIYKIKINFRKIILDNFGMIIILAIYEYMFFKSIILLYENISQNELIKLMVNQFNTCLI